MARIFAPNNQYTGISASVPFINGTGETDNPDLIKWFRDRGYTVEEVETPDTSGKTDDLGNMTIQQLKAYAEEKGIDIGKATSQEGILKKILEDGKETD